jgi:hypothetical protein
MGVPEAQSESPRAPEAPARGAAAEETNRNEPRLAAALVRRASLRRAGRWARCEVVLRRSVDAERVRCRLVRNGRVVARAARAVTDQRAVMRLEGTGRVASGAYTLVVATIDADGAATSQRIRLTLR